MIAMDITRVFGQHELTIKLKWRASAGTGWTWVGPYAADLNNDGLMEIVINGQNGIAALNATDGSVIWKKNYTAAHGPCEIIDLNKDGVPEILFIPDYVNGTASYGVLALHGNDGSVYWYNRNAAGDDTYIAVADINADGYPEIYSVKPGLVTALTYDGRIFASTYTYYSCYGGLSISDTNFDGVFEVYLGERSESYPSYPSGGRGLRAFWADNLTEIWCDPQILCSSQAPVLADVDKDGDLEIIILHQRGGIAVYNTDGSVNTYNGKYRKQLSIPGLPNGHDNPPIADLDGDGNLELITCSNANHDPTPPKIWDLVDWKLDATLPFPCPHPPGLADVDGDGQWEILDCNPRNVTIFKYNKSTGNYNIMPFIYNGAISYAIPIANAHSFFIAQDIDDNGKLDLIFNEHNSWISVYEVEAPEKTAPTPLPRSGLSFYSQYRTRVPEYVPPPGPQEPRITEVSPSESATNVPITLSQLSFKLTDYQCDPINYTVTTNPDIGSATGINVPNGKITVPVSGLTYSTTYTWTITATDGTYTTTKTFKFTTIDLAPWYNSNWQYRKKVIIDHTKVIADQTNFPILIDLTDPDLTKAQPDGDAILFTDQNQVKLSHEIEKYDGVTGRLIAWVKIPYLSSTTNTILYMYYGNSTCENQQNPTGVWDANYKLVMHLNEAIGAHYDSTINGNHGTPYGSLVQGAIGFIGSCVEFNGGYIQLPQVCTSETQFTFSAWIYPRSGARYFISEWWSYQGVFLQVSSDGRYIEFYINNVIVSSTSITLDTWYYVVGTFDGKTAILYVNNRSPTSKSTSSPTWPSQNMYIGDRSDHTRKFYGLIDEVRVSNIARSAAWILTEYNNQLDPTAFYLLEPEEALPNEPFISKPYPADGAKNIPITLNKLSFSLTDYQNDLMNVTVTTNPNIGSLSLINVPTRQYVVSISGLNYATLYTWTIDATDGVYTATKTFTFMTEAPLNWWDVAWKYRRTITIDHTKVSEELTDFPVLIEITDSSLAEKAQPDGDDFVFTNANNVKLDHQIEYYNSATGHLIAWVKVPYLSSTTDTIIYMYYGNPNCASQQNPTGVWDSSYMFVLHLNEETGTHYDSTLYGNNGIPLNGILQGVLGQIDGADTFDGINDYIAIPHSDALTGYAEAFTVSFWIKIEDTSRRQTILCKYNAAGNMRSWQIEYDPTWQRPFWLFASENGITYSEWWASWDAFKPEPDVWYYLTVVWEKNSIPKFYVNGVQVPPVGTGKISSIFNNVGVPLYIGRSVYSTRYFKGSLDEIIILNRTLSANWILTAYNNQRNPAAFYTIGPEEQYAGTSSNSLQAGNINNSYTQQEISLAYLSPITLLAAVPVSLNIRRSKKRENK
jgi:hypothetical protein